MGKRHVGGGWTATPHETFTGLLDILRNRIRHDSLYTLIQFHQEVKQNEIRTAKFIRESLGGDVISPIAVNRSLDAARRHFKTLGRTLGLVNDLDICQLEVTCERIASTLMLFEMGRSLADSTISAQPIIKNIGGQLCRLLSVTYARQRAVPNRTVDRTTLMREWLLDLEVKADCVAYLIIDDEPGEITSNPSLFRVRSSDATCKLQDLKRCSSSTSRNGNSVAVLASGSPESLDVIDLEEIRIARSTQCTLDSLLWVLFNPAVSFKALIRFFESMEDIAANLRNFCNHVSKQIRVSPGVSMPDLISSVLNTLSMIDKSFLLATDAPTSAVPSGGIVKTRCCSHADYWLTRLWQTSIQELLMTPTSVSINAFNAPGAGLFRFLNAPVLAPGTKETLICVLFHIIDAIRTHVCQTFYGPIFGVGPAQNGLFNCHPDDLNKAREMIKHAFVLVRLLCCITKICLSRSTNSSEVAARYFNMVGVTIREMIPLYERVCVATEVALSAWSCSDSAKIVHKRTLLYKVRGQSFDTSSGCKDIQIPWPEALTDIVVIVEGNGKESEVEYSEADMPDDLRYSVIPMSVVRRGFHHALNVGKLSIWIRRVYDSRAVSRGDSADGEHLLNQLSRRPLLTIGDCNDILKKCESLDLDETTAFLVQGCKRSEETNYQGQVIGWLAPAEGSLIEPILFNVGPPSVHNVTLWMSRYRRGGGTGHEYSNRLRVECQKEWLQAVVELNEAATTAVLKVCEIGVSPEITKIIADHPDVYLNSSYRKVLTKLLPQEIPNLLLRRLKCPSVLTFQTAFGEQHQRERRVPIRNLFVMDGEDVAASLPLEQSMTMSIMATDELSLQKHLAIRTKKASMYTPVPLPSMAYIDRVEELPEPHAVLKIPSYSTYNWRMFSDPNAQEINAFGLAAIAGSVLQDGFALQCSFPFKLPVTSLCLELFATSIISILRRYIRVNTGLIQIQRSGYLRKILTSMLNSLRLVMNCSANQGRSICADVHRVIAETKAAISFLSGIRRSDSSIWSSGGLRRHFPSTSSLKELRRCQSISRPAEPISTGGITLYPYPVLPLRVSQFQMVNSEAGLISCDESVHLWASPIFREQLPHMLIGVNSVPLDRCSWWKICISEPQSLQLVVESYQHIDQLINGQILPARANSRCVFHLGSNGVRGEICEMDGFVNSTSPVDEAEADVAETHVGFASPPVCHGTVINVIIEPNVKKRRIRVYAGRRTWTVPFPRTTFAKKIPGAAGFRSDERMATPMTRNSIGAEDTEFQSVGQSYSPACSSMDCNEKHLQQNIKQYVSFSNGRSDQAENFSLEKPVVVSRCGEMKLAIISSSNIRNIVQVMRYNPAADISNNVKDPEWMDSILVPKVYNTSRGATSDKFPWRHDNKQLAHFYNVRLISVRLYTPIPVRTWTTPVSQKPANKYMYSSIQHVEVYKAILTHRVMNKTIWSSSVRCARYEILAEPTQIFSFSRMWSQRYSSAVRHIVGLVNLSGYNSDIAGVGAFSKCTWHYKNAYSLLAIFGWSKTDLDTSSAEPGDFYQGFTSPVQFKEYDIGSFSTKTEPLERATSMQDTGEIGSETALLHYDDISEYLTGIARKSAAHSFLSNFVTEGGSAALEGVISAIWRSILMLLKVVVGFLDSAQPRPSSDLVVELLSMALNIAIALETEVSEQRIVLFPDCMETPSANLIKEATSETDNILPLTLQHHGFAQEVIQILARYLTPLVTGAKMMEPDIKNIPFDKPTEEDPALAPRLSKYRGSIRASVDVVHCDWKECVGCEWLANRSLMGIQSRLFFVASNANSGLSHLPKIVPDLPLQDAPNESISALKLLMQPEKRLAPCSGKKGNEIRAPLQIVASNMFDSRRQWRCDTEQEGRHKFLQSLCPAFTTGYQGLKRKCLIEHFQVPLSTPEQRRRYLPSLDFGYLTAWAGQYLGDQFSLEKDKYHKDLLSDDSSCGASSIADESSNETEEDDYPDDSISQIEGRETLSLSSPSSGNVDLYNHIMESSRTQGEFDSEFSRTTVVPAPDDPEEDGTITAPSVEDVMTRDSEPLTPKSNSQLVDDGVGCRGVPKSPVVCRFRRSPVSDTPEDDSSPVSRFRVMWSPTPRSTRDHLGSPTSRRRNVSFGATISPRHSRTRRARSSGSTASMSFIPKRLDKRYSRRIRALNHHSASAMHDVINFDEFFEHEGVPVLGIPLWHPLVPYGPVMSKLALSSNICLLDCSLAMKSDCGCDLQHMNGTRLLRNIGGFLGDDYLIKSKTLPPSLLQMADPLCDRHIVVSCPDGHQLQEVRTMNPPIQWRCDAFEREETGCRHNNSEFKFRPGHSRWRCEECDIDYCDLCYSEYRECRKKQVLRNLGYSRDRYLFGGSDDGVQILWRGYWWVIPDAMIKQTGGGLDSIMSQLSDNVKWYVAGHRSVVDFARIVSLWKLGLVAQNATVSYYQCCWSGSGILPSLPKPVPLKVLIPVETWVAGRPSLHRPLADIIVREAVESMRTDSYPETIKFIERGLSECIMRTLVASQLAADLSTAYERQQELTKAVEQLEELVTNQSLSQCQYEKQKRLILNAVLSSIVTWRRQNDSDDSSSSDKSSLWSFSLREGDNSTQIPSILREEIPTVLKSATTYDDASDCENDRDGEDAQYHLYNSSGNAAGVMEDERLEALFVEMDELEALLESPNYSWASGMTVKVSSDALRNGGVLTAFRNSLGAIPRYISQHLSTNWTPDGSVSLESTTASVTYHMSDGRDHPRVKGVWHFPGTTRLNVDHAGPEELKECVKVERMSLADVAVELQYGLVTPRVHMTGAQVQRILNSFFHSRSPSRGADSPSPSNLTTVAPYRSTLFWPTPIEDNTTHLEVLAWWLEVVYRHPLALMCFETYTPIEHVANYLVHSAGAPPSEFGDYHKRANLPYCLSEMAIMAECQSGFLSNLFSINSVQYRLHVATGLFLSLRFIWLALEITESRKRLQLPPLKEVKLIPWYTACGWSKLCLLLSILDGPNWFDQNSLGPRLSYMTALAWFCAQLNQVCIEADAITDKTFASNSQTHSLWSLIQIVASLLKCAPWASAEGQSVIDAEKQCRFPCPPDVSPNAFRATFRCRSVLHWLLDKVTSAREVCRDIVYNERICGGQAREADRLLVSGQLSIPFLSPLGHSISVPLIHTTNLATLQRRSWQEISPPSSDGWQMEWNASTIPPLLTVLHFNQLPVGVDLRLIASIPAKQADEIAPCPAKNSSFTQHLIFRSANRYFQDYTEHGTSEGLTIRDIITPVLERPQEKASLIIQLVDPSCLKPTEVTVNIKLTPKICASVQNSSWGVLYDCVPSAIANCFAQFGITLSVNRFGQIIDARVSSSESLDTPPHIQQPLLPAHLLPPPSACYTHIGGVYPGILQATDSQPFKPMVESAVGYYGQEDLSPGSKADKCSTIGPVLPGDPRRHDTFLDDEYHNNEPTRQETDLFKCVTPQTMALLKVDIYPCDNRILLFIRRYDDGCFAWHLLGLFPIHRPPQITLRPKPKSSTYTASSDVLSPILGFDMLVTCERYIPEDLKVFVRVPEAHLGLVEGHEKCIQPSSFISAGNLFKLQAIISGPAQVHKTVNESIQIFESVYATDQQPTNPKPLLDALNILEEFQQNARSMKPELEKLEQPVCTPPVYEETEPTRPQSPVMRTQIESSLDAEAGTSEWGAPIQSTIEQSLSRDETATQVPPAMQLQLEELFPAPEKNQVRVSYAYLGMFGSLVETGGASANIAKQHGLKRTTTRQIWPKAISSPPTTLDIGLLPMTVSKKLRQRRESLEGATPAADSIGSSGSGELSSATDEDDFVPPSLRFAKWKKSVQMIHPSTSAEKKEKPKCYYCEQAEEDTCSSAITEAFTPALVTLAHIVTSTVWRILSGEHVITNRVGGRLVQFVGKECSKVLMYCNAKLKSAGGGPSKFTQSMVPALVLHSLKLVMLRLQEKTKNLAALCCINATTALPPLPYRETSISIMSQFPSACYLAPLAPILPSKIAALRSGRPIEYVFACSVSEWVSHNFQWVLDCKVHPAHPGLQLHRMTNSLVALASNFRYWAQDGVWKGQPTSTSYDGIGAVGSLYNSARRDYSEDKPFPLSMPHPGVEIKSLIREKSRRQLLSSPAVHEFLKSLTIAEQFEEFRHFSVPLCRTAANAEGQGCWDGSIFSKKCLETLFERSMTTTIANREDCTFDSTADIDKSDVNLMICWLLNIQLRLYAVHGAMDLPSTIYKVLYKMQKGLTPWNFSSVLRSEAPKVGSAVIQIERGFNLTRDSKTTAEDSAASLIAGKHIDRSTLLCSTLGQLTRTISLVRNPLELCGNDRPMKLILEGEGAQDLGGPFLEAVSEAIALFEEVFLTQNPNADSELAMNKDINIFRPNISDQLDALTFNWPCSESCGEMHTLSVAQSFLWTGGSCHGAVSMNLFPQRMWEIRSQRIKSRFTDRQYRLPYLRNLMEFVDEVQSLIEEKLAVEKQMALYSVPLSVIAMGDVVKSRILCGLGMLLAACCQTSNPVNVSVHPALWRMIAGENITWADCLSIETSELLKVQQWQSAIRSIEKVFYAEDDQLDPLETPSPPFRDTSDEQIGGSYESVKELWEGLTLDFWESEGVNPGGNEILPKSLADILTALFNLLKFIIMLRLDSSRDSATTKYIPTELQRFMFPHTTNLVSVDRVCGGANNNDVVKLTKKLIDLHIMIEKDRRRTRRLVALRFVKSGFHRVIPVLITKSFVRAKDIEIATCGYPVIDVDVLKEHMKIEFPDNINEAEAQCVARIVSWLFEILTEFDQRMRRLFLRFVTGLSTLPASWTNPHHKRGRHANSLECLYCRIYRAHEIMDNGDVLTAEQIDKRLPTATTCFQILKIPMYSSKEVLAERLTTALLICCDIDLDAMATDFGAD